MKYFAWDNTKNKKLQKDRGISFEEIIIHIEKGNLLDVIENPSKKYLNQMVFVVEVNRYAYLVPFVKSDTKLFLKTIIPSRKANQEVFGGLVMAKLDKAEKDLLQSFENDEWSSVEELSSEKKRLQEIARFTMQKNRRINIRISEKDLDGLKLRAVEEGIPYQTLISSVLHKYISGKLVEKNFCQP